VLFELLGGEDEPLIRLPSDLRLVSVVEAIHDKLPIDGNRLLAVVVEVNAAAETTHRRLPRLRVHRGRPDHDHLGRLLVKALLFRALPGPGKFRSVGQDRLAARRRGQQSHDQPVASRPGVHQIILDHTAAC
jgi:hypothetical protein